MSNPLFANDERLTLEQVKLRLETKEHHIVFEVRDFGSDVTIVYSESNDHTIDDSRDEIFGFLFWTMDGRVFEPQSGLTLKRACQLAFNQVYTEVSDDPEVLIP